MKREHFKITSREDWLKWRLKDVTASDIAAVCGLHPHKTALGLYAEKSGEIKDGGEDNPTLRRGRWMEPAVVEALRETRPEAAIERGSEYWRLPEVSIGATPDGFITESGTKRLLECKTVAKWKFEDDWDNGPPPHYVLQALTAAMVTDCPGALLAALVVDGYTCELQTFDVPRHPAAEKKLLEDVDRFWSDTATGQMPKADYGRDGKLLALLKPPREGQAPLDLSDDNYIYELLDEYENVNEAYKAAEKRRKEIQAEITDKLDGAPEAIVNGWKITNKMQHRKETIQKASTFPVMRIKRTQEKEQAA